MPPKKKKEDEAGPSLDDVMDEINKEYGDGSAINAATIPPCNHLDTGIFTLDLALMGGLPKGFATMLFGADSAGKSLVTLKSVAQWQKHYPDQYAVLFDPENLFDNVFAAKLGVDNSRLKLLRPGSGEAIVNCLDGIMKVKGVRLIIIDSLAGMVPKAVAETAAEDDTRAQHARLLNKMISKIQTHWYTQGKISDRTSFIFTNQVRDDQNARFPGQVKIPGGRQIKHFCVTRVYLKNREKMGSDGSGNEVVAYNEHSFDMSPPNGKAKMGVAMREGVFELNMNASDELGVGFGGCYDAPSVMAFAKRYSLIGGGGQSWKIHVFPEVEPFKNLDSVTSWLWENKEYLTRLKQIICGIHRVSKGIPAVPPDRWLMGGEVSEHDEALIRRLGAVSEGGAE